MRPESEHTTSDQVVKPEDLGFDTPEKIEKRRKWFAGPGNPQGRSLELVKYGEHLKSQGFTVRRPFSSVEYLIKLNTLGWKFGVLLGRQTCPDVGD